MKDWRNIALVLLALAVLYFIWYTSTRKCFYLPSDKDPDVWGAHYWNAFHSIAEKVPCPSCKAEAVPLMVFVHDLINLKLGKKLNDVQNFNNHISTISKIEQHLKSNPKLYYFLWVD